MGYGLTIMTDKTIFIKLTAVPGSELRAAGAEVPILAMALPSVAIAKAIASQEFDEVVDTIGDLLVVSSELEGRLADGFQLQDVLAAALAPEFTELINDLPEAIQQAKGIRGKNAIDIVEKIGARVESDARIRQEGRITSKVLETIELAVFTTDYLTNTIGGGQEIYTRGKLLFGIETPTT